MLTSDTDAYYSPTHVAEVVAETVGRSRLNSVVDSHCGRGALLDAMERNFPRVHCAGIDLDDKAISQLRRSRPHWTLVRGDSLSQATWKELRPRLGASVDVAVLNPPFSMGQAKGLEIAYHGQMIRGSLAMAHVLATLQHSNPARIVAILPESAMFSELDKGGRAILDSLYHVHIEEQFKNSTFRGARVNSVLVAMNRRKTPRTKPSPIDPELVRPEVEIVRGGLPCFEATESRGGMHFVHSTDIRKLVRGYPLSKLLRVHPFSRGVASGHMVLLPRVGVPTKENIGAWHTERQIQLSDCVLALQYKCASAAQAGAESMWQRYQSLAQLYRGTGARYVTLERLSKWLQASRSE